MQQQYAFLAGTAWAAGGGHGWWRALNGSKDGWLDPAEVAAASICVRFATLPEHVQRLTSQIGLSVVDGQALLQRLITRGLLVTPNSMVPAVSVEAPMLDAPIIAIRSYARPASLRRLLLSMQADEQHFGTRRRHLVIDDGDEVGMAATNAAIVAEMAQVGMNIGYFGPDLRRRGLQALAVEGESADVIAALSAGEVRAPTGARAWNWALLLAAGRTLSFVDDDCEFPIRLPEQSARTWSLQNSLANEGRFYDDVMPELPVSDEDPYLLMRSIVGQTTGALWHRDGVAANHFGGRLTSDFQCWQSNRRVLAASGGIYGGHVYNSAVYFNIADIASLKNLLRPPFRLDRLDGERIWQGVSAARITSAAVYSPLLLDARELLPFAGSFGKADDTGFFGLLSAVEPAPAYAYLPLLMGHRPEEDRARRERAGKELLLDGNHYLGYFAQRAATQLFGQDRCARMTAITALAADLVHAGEADFRNDLQAWRGRNISAVIAGIDESRRLVGAQAPAEWLAFIAQIEHANRKAMGEPMPEQRVGECRSTIRQLAQLGNLWPHWWQTMRAGLADDLLAASGLQMA